MLRTPTSDDYIEIVIQEEKSEFMLSASAQMSLAACMLSIYQLATQNSDPAKTPNSMLALPLSIASLALALQQHIASNTMIDTTLEQQLSNATLFGSFDRINSLRSNATLFGSFDRINSLRSNATLFGSFDRINSLRSNATLFGNL